MRRSPVIWIAGQIKRRIPALVLLTLSRVVNALLSVSFALGTRGVIDGAVEGDPAEFAAACAVQAGIVLGILVSQFFMRHLRELLLADLEKDWKRGLLHGLLYGEYAKVSAYHSGELLNRLNNDVAKINEGILTIVPSAAAMVTQLIAAVAVLGMLDARFAVVIALLGLVVLGATAFMRHKLKGLNQRVSEFDGKVSGFLQETMENLLMVQAMDVSSEVERRSDELLQGRYRIQRKKKNVSLFANTAISVMFYGAGFLALAWCAGQLLQGRMTFGSLTAVIQLVNQVQAPFVNLTGILPQYVAMIASAERLMELEQIQGQQQPTQNRDQLYEKMNAVCAQGLSFSYDRDKVLRNVQFRLPKGAFTVVMGPSGMGKSTVLKLLLGIFRPDSGSLYLETDEGEIPLDRGTRGIFAYVPQGNLLFSGSLRENLTIVKPEASEEALRQALYVSCLDECLLQLPMGLDTVLGENAQGLSEGQAQRLSIARAVLSGAPVLLLDECTSALDAETEAVVLERLKALKDRTCIAVTHRPAAVALADWLLSVDVNGVDCKKLR